MRAMSRGVGGCAGGAGGRLFWLGVFPRPIGDKGGEGVYAVTFSPPGEATDFCSAVTMCTGSESWRVGKAVAERSLSVLRRVNCNKY